MNKIAAIKLDKLSNKKLAQRMDDLLSAPYWTRRGNEIMHLNTTEILNTKCVQSFKPDFQRKILYKTFGLLLQLHYTDFSVSAQFFRIPDKDTPLANQIYSAARNQWTYISSRIIFEYFMHITYMLGTGKDFPGGKSAINKYKNWLKEKNNPYTYFAVCVVRSECYDRKKRSPEIHAGTKLARQILLTSATEIDNDMFNIVNTIRNQWQFVLSIANGKDSKNLGWVISGENDDDRRWYEIWESGNQKNITEQIDKIFNQNNNGFGTIT